MGDASRPTLHLHALNNGSNGSNNGDNRNEECANVATSPASLTDFLSSCSPAMSTVPLVLTSSSSASASSMASSSTSPAETTSTIATIATMEKTASSASLSNSANFTPALLVPFVIILMIALVFLVKKRRRSNDDIANNVANKAYEPTYRQPFPPWTNLPLIVDFNDANNDSNNNQDHPSKIICPPPHPLFNHLPHVFSPPDSHAYNSLFSLHANPSGITTFYFLSTPCIAILKGEHVRTVLRSSVERRGYGIFSRHFRKSLGKDSLVIMNGNGPTTSNPNVKGDIDRWRKHRNLVKVAFTSNAVKKMSGKVWRVANRLVESVLRECDENDDSKRSVDYDDGNDEVFDLRREQFDRLDPLNHLDHQVNNKTHDRTNNETQLMTNLATHSMAKNETHDTTNDKTHNETNNKTKNKVNDGTYLADALDLFKWATLDVFGLVSLNYDFSCTTNLMQTSIASSFDFAIEDSNERCLPKNLFNPLTQCYWLPTKRNKEYAFHSRNVRDLLGGICERSWANVLSEREFIAQERREERDLAMQEFQQRREEERNGIGFGGGMMKVQFEEEVKESIKKTTTGVRSVCLDGGYRRKSLDQESYTTSTSTRSSFTISDEDDLLTILLKNQAQERDENVKNNNGTDDSNKKRSCFAPFSSNNQSPKGDPYEEHREMIEMLMTLFFAGYDTSSIGLTYAMYSLSTHPDKDAVQEECAREARAFSLEVDDLECDASEWEHRLGYCWGVVMETLRLHPPVYTNVRNCTKDLVLEDTVEGADDGNKIRYTIPAGSRVYVPITQVHTDERNFARPLEFLPERWVKRDERSGMWVPRDYHAEGKAMKEHNDKKEQSPNSTTQQPGSSSSSSSSTPSSRFSKRDQIQIPAANPHYLFTFSDGARNCVGRRLAIQEMTVLLSCIMRDLKVDVSEGYVLKKRKKFAMAPPTEMPLVLRRRE